MRRIGKLPDKATFCLKGNIKRHCKLLICSAFIGLKLYSRWESNPNLRFRKPPFYPLNYRSIIEIGWLVAWHMASRFIVS